MDDVTSGANNDEEAFQFYEKAKIRLAEGGFNLRKFTTNSSELQARINFQEGIGVTQFNTGQPEKIAAEGESYVKSTLGDNRPNLGLKVLGIQWQCTSDQLVFDLSHIHELAAKTEPTKRHIIAFAASFYDPLGILSPFTVQFKILFQELCVVKVSWDEPLSGELLMKWRKLVDGMKQIRSIIVPRCYFGLNEKKTSCCLQGFCDASTHAYAAVVYLRVQTSVGTTAKFVAARTRVSPLQGHSIPRLELLGALLLSRLLASVSAALMVELELDPPSCFTDSKVALFWIKGHDKEWRQFVENRVREIRQLTPVNVWKHCPGIDNPADLPSRGAELSMLIDDPLWLNGPKWLCGINPTEDCELPPENAVLEECVLEMRNKERLQVKGAHNLLSTTGLDTVINCENFSSLTRLLRTTAYVRKFTERVKAKVKGTTEHVSPELNVTDLAVSELYWITISQRMLVQDDQFSNWKTQFGLYLDESGVWRCKDRLCNADLPVATKFPIILPNGHHFTTLVVMDCHKRVMHGGVKETLTELRTRFWIVRGRSLLRRLLHSCVTCIRLDGQVYNVPRSPPLPHFRVQESFPFTYVGVDYAGPLYIKGPQPKAWIILFTCCVTRALHLDLVLDMSTETFIWCFRRFAARRGIPRKIVSDNSKTFKSACKEFEGIQDGDMGGYFTNRRIEWCFNLEKAPWWGGFFERLVRSVKRCLKKVIGHSRLSYDDLLTLVVEIEGTLNSRPLTFMAADDLEEPLTPSHLLTGHRVLRLPDSSIPEVDPDFMASTDRAHVTSWMSHLNLLLQHFWKRWSREYLTELRDAHRYSASPRGSNKEITIGDIVLVHDEKHPRAFWKLGRVEKLIKGQDGNVRGAVIRFHSNTGTSVLKRPSQMLYPLEIGCGDVVGGDGGVTVPKVPADKEIPVKRPQRIAAVKARLRMREWAEDSTETDPID